MIIHEYIINCKLATIRRRGRLDKPSVGGIQY